MVDKYRKGSVLQISKSLPSVYHCWPSKGPLKPNFLNIYVTTFFRVRIFENTSAMRVIIFFDNIKNLVYISKKKKKKKKLEKVFCVSDISIRIGCLKLSLSRREYLSSTVNVLTKSLMFLYITKRDVFCLNCLQGDQ